MGEKSTLNGVSLERRRILAERGDRWEGCAAQAGGGGGDDDAGREAGGVDEQGGCEP